MIGQTRYDDHLAKLIGQCLDFSPNADAAAVTQYVLSRDGYAFTGPTGNCILDTHIEISRILRQRFGRTPPAQQKAADERAALIAEAEAYFAEQKKELPDKGAEMSRKGTAARGRVAHSLREWFKQ